MAIKMGICDPFLVQPEGWQERKPSLAKSLYIFRSKAPINKISAVAPITRRLNVRFFGDVAGFGGTLRQQFLGSATPELWHFACPSLDPV